MKIPCDICGNVEAEVLCSADEAVLCWGCDERVHTANKLSQKHQRVPLLKHPPSTSSSQLPPCDICQEKSGYFFCLEDRALLCKNCDVSTHSTNSYVSSHRRFVISGIKVALQSVTNNYRTGCNSRTYHLDMPNSNSSSVNFPMDREKKPEMTTEVASTSSDMVAMFSGEIHLATGPEWTLDEILGSNDFDYYEFSDMGQSRISSQ
ncbi:hypothetical protein AAG906_000477 [Vitis piasezkii]